MMPVGSTNSQRTVKFDRPRPVEVGIDTWRLARYMDSDRERGLVSSFTRGGLDHPRVGGYRLDYSPASGLLGIEGHPAVEGLGDPAGLIDSEASALTDLRDAGLPIGREAGVGRLDLTTTLDFGDPRRGLVFLSGLAVVDVPRRQVQIRRAPGNGPVETVEFRGPSGRSILSRAYDKGVERAARGDLDRSAPAGHLVRLEAQNRFAKRARMGATVLARNPEIPAALFKGRFAPVADSAEGLTAATADVLGAELVRRVQTGELRGQAAERMSGFLLLRGTGLSAETKRRRRRELRAHGLVLADPFSDPIEVDLGEGVDAALEAWS
ncbi:MAG: hypothetical protein WBQ41_03445 [Solirubrobacterales bacterium]